MGNISCANISFDFEKSCYDLAMLYTKTKFDEAIATKNFSGIQVPKEIEEMDYISNEFYSSLGYFSNQTEEYIKALVDSE